MLVQTLWPAGSRLDGPPDAARRRRGFGPTAVQAAECREAWSLRLVRSSTLRLDPASTRTPRWGLDRALEPVSEWRCDEWMKVTAAGRVSPRRCRSGRRRVRPTVVLGGGRGHIIHQVPAAVAVGPVQLPAAPGGWGWGVSQLGDRHRRPLRTQHGRPGWTQLQDGHGAAPHPVLDTDLVLQRCRDPLLAPAGDLVQVQLGNGSRGHRHRPPLMVAQSSPAGQRTGQLQQPVLDGGQPLVADLEAAMLQQPGGSSTPPHRHPPGPTTSLEIG
jgi:hypothetical protein